MNEKHGTLKAITGCMFSGKSATMLRDRSRLQAAGVKYIAAKPAADLKNGFNIRTRDHANSEYAQELNDPGRLLNLSYKGGYVLIDEVQFLDLDYLSAIREGLARGCSYIVAGLDTDFRGNPFLSLDPVSEKLGIMPSLLAIADQVEKLTAICTICKGEATRTQRLIESRNDGKPKLDPAFDDGPTIDKPGQFVYEARCRTHHIVPKRPKL